MGNPERARVIAMVGLLDGDRNTAALRVELQGPVTFTSRTPSGGVIFSMNERDERRLAAAFRDENAIGIRTMTGVEDTDLQYVSPRGQVLPVDHTHAFYPSVKQSQITVIRPPEPTPPLPPVPDRPAIPRTGLGRITGPLVDTVRRVTGSLSLHK